MHSFETYVQLQLIDCTVCWYQYLGMSQTDTLLPFCQSGPQMVRSRNIYGPRYCLARPVVLPTAIYMLTFQSVQRTTGVVQSIYFCVLV